MELVVDTNVLISALVKNSSSRELLCDPRLVLFAPEHLLSEISGNRKIIVEKSGISEAKFNQLYAFLLLRVAIVKQDRFGQFLGEALELAQHQEDSPFIALALAYDIPIWSNDKGLKQQPKVEILSTGEVVKHLSATAP